MALYCTYVQNGVYNAPDDRFAQGAVFARDTDGNIRKGIIAFSAHDGAATVVAGTLSVGVQAFTAVIPDASGRGAYVGGVDSTTVVDALAPETTNNRVDVLCFRHLEGQSTDSRGVSTLGSVTLAGQSTAITKQVVPGELHWVKGTPSASSSPSVPAVPANSVPISRVYVAGGASALVGSNLTDARVFTGVSGSQVLWPGAAPGGSFGSWAVGSEVVNPTTGQVFLSTPSGVMAPQPVGPTTLMRKVRLTMSGSMPQDVNANMVGAQTIPANPFGPGVNYMIRLVGPGRIFTTPGGMWISFTVDGNVVEELAYGHAGTGSAALAAQLEAMHFIDTPGVAHAVVGRVKVQRSSVTAPNDTNMNFYVVLAPAETF